MLVPLCPSFLVYIGSPAQFSVFPELMLGPGRNGRDVVGHPFSASQNHRQPDGDALKVLMGGRFGAQRQVGEEPPRMPPRSGEKGGILSIHRQGNADPELKWVSEGGFSRQPWSAS